MTPESEPVLSAADLEARRVADLPHVLAPVDDGTLVDLERHRTRYLVTLAESDPSIRALLVERGLREAPP